MRNLVKKENLLFGGTFGASLGILCIPYIMIKTAHPGLLQLQCITIVPLCILLGVVVRAWTPFAGRTWLRPSLKSHEVWLLLAGTVPAALFARFLTDPIVLIYRPEYFPKGLGDFLASLPWVAGFQPVFFVAATYAFTVRLTAKPMHAFILILMLQQYVLYLKLENAASVDYFILAAGTGTLVMVQAVLYHMYGLVAPIILMAVMQFRCLIPIG